MDKLIDKIKKLLALANDGGASEGEADAAMARVHDLLAKHNLDLDQIPIDEQDFAPVMGEDFYPMESKDIWIHWVWHEVADVYFCQYFNVNSSRYGVRRAIVGEEHNRVIVKNLIDYLVTTIRRLTDEMMSGQGRSIRYSFQQGMAARICTRLREMKQEKIQAQTVTSEGLQLPALRNVYEKTYENINSHLDVLGWGEPKKAKRANTYEVDPFAFSAGQLVGDDVSLQPQLGGQATPQPIGCIEGGAA